MGISFEALNPMRQIENAEKDVLGMVEKIIPAIDGLRDRDDDLSRKSLKNWDNEFKKFGFDGVNDGYNELKKLGEDFKKYIRNNKGKALMLLPRLNQIKKFLRDQRLIS